jgi:hypothetical protein
VIGAGEVARPHRRVRAPARHGVRDRFEPSGSFSEFGGQDVAQIFRSTLFVIRQRNRREHWRDGHVRQVRPITHEIARRADNGTVPSRIANGGNVCGTGFWHEVYLMRGGMEGVYADLNLPPVGFQGFAPSLPAHGGMFSARQRLRLAGETPAQPSGVAESDLG